MFARNADGYTVNLLNEPEVQQPPSKPKRFICGLAECARSFHTIGHLHRHELCVHQHHRPFHCVFPGCTSNFSRNDNRWQHYRTHFAPRRASKKIKTDIL
ncbi:transcriptional repressor [Coelomomyces lativittatus]|nr:transcriptional repressor [Coelomomyces lativittatus]